MNAEAAEAVEARGPPAPSPMRETRLGKVVINMGVGKSGEPLEKAKTVLQRIVPVKACTRRARDTVREFGIRKSEPIAVVATLRGREAEEFLGRALRSAGNRLDASSFDGYGNFSFGIKEHIELPGVRYDPALGIFGMDVCVSLVRPGYRVGVRRRRRARVGRGHRVGAEEAMDFVRQRFRVEVTR